MSRNYNGIAGDLFIALAIKLIQGKFGCTLSAGYLTILPGVQ